MSIGTRRGPALRNAASLAVVGMNPESAIERHMCPYGDGAVQGRARDGLRVPRASWERPQGADQGRIALPHDDGVRASAGNSPEKHSGRLQPLEIARCVCGVFARWRRGMRAFPREAGSMHQVRGRQDAPPGGQGTTGINDAAGVSPLPGRQPGQCGRVVRHHVGECLRGCHAGQSRRGD